MTETISRLGRVEWNLTPSTTFATTMSQAGWVIMTVESPFDDTYHRFGLFIKGKLINFDNYPKELKEAIPSFFDPCFQDDEYVDFIESERWVATADEINHAATHVIDWESEKLAQIQEDQEFDEAFPGASEILEQIGVWNAAAYAEDDGWNMIGFMNQLSLVLNAKVSFYTDHTDFSEFIEIAFKPIEPIRDSERTLQMIARKMSRWLNFDEVHGRLDFTPPFQS